MSASPAVLRRSRLYSLVARMVILTLLLQGLVPVPGLGSPVAQAGRSSPATEPATPPPGSLGVPLAPATPVYPKATPVPQLPVVALPVTVTLTASAVAAPGDAITYTVAVTNTGATALNGLRVRAYLPQPMHWLPGQAWQQVPENREIFVNVPLVPWHGTLRRSFALRVDGQPAGGELIQKVEVLQPATGAVMRVEALTHVTATETVGHIGPAGGIFTSGDGRLRIEFGAGAVSVPVRVTHRWGRLGDFWPGYFSQFFVAQLAAVEEASGQPITTFNAPVTVTLNVAGLVAPEDYFTIRQRRTPFDPWETLAGPLRADPLTGQVHVQVTHFSEIEGGGEALYDGWHMSFTDAQVATFSGGASYQVAVAMPPARAGLAPELTLSYNSRSVDGIGAWIQTDWAGLGFSADPPQITRKINPGNDWRWGWAGYENKFTLLFGGAGYDLVPEDPNQYYGRYHTQRDEFLLVERRNAQWCLAVPDRCEPEDVAQNTTSEYWVIRTQDGTEYRLGYYPESEQLSKNQCRYSDDPGPWCYGEFPSFPPLNGRYAGEALHIVTYRWRLDRVRDALGNETAYHYFEEGDGFRDYASYLSEVDYTQLDAGAWAHKIVLVRGQRGALDQGGDGVRDWQPGWWMDPYWWQHDYLKTIEVRAGDGSLIRAYDLVYGRTRENGTLEQRRLASVRQRAPDDSVLPTTTFTYTEYDNKDRCYDGWPGCYTDWDKATFSYDRLSRIDNGYGGIIDLTYDHFETPWWAMWNYHVTRKVSSSALGPVTRVDYAYGPLSQRCYDNNDDDGCEYFTQAGDAGGHLVGIGTVTETLMTPDGATVFGVTGHTFHLNHSAEEPLGLALGRELETRRLSPAGTLLARTAQSYGDRMVAPGVSHFIYLSSTLSAGYDGGEAVETQVNYDYDSLGNVTHEQYLGDLTVAGDEKLIVREYYPNTDLDHWVLGLRRTERVYTGTVQTDYGTEAAMTAYGYDYGEPIFAPEPPTAGLLTAVRQYITPTANFRYDYAKMVTTTFEYDSYGNQRLMRDPLGRQTTTEFDAATHTFPVQTTNAATPPHVSTLDYDFTTGQVLTVTNANGVATLLRYDVFGRLTKVIQDGDTVELPTTQYNYYDYYVAPGGQRLLMVETWQREQSGTGAVRPLYEYYDGLGRLLQTRSEIVDAVTQAVGNVEYDAAGRTVRTYAPLSATYGVNYVPLTEPERATLPRTQVQYDAVGRTVVVTGTDSMATRSAYRGRATAVLDANGHQKVSVVDAYGQLVQVQEYAGYIGTEPNFYAPVYATTQYEYNVLGNLVRVTDDAAHVTTMYFNALGQKLAMTDPDMGAWQYAYNAAGNLTSQRDAKLQYTCFYYDALNRLKGKVLSGASACSPTDPGYGSYSDAYAYDQPGHGYGIGQRTMMTNTNAVVSWTYDRRGRVTAETRTIVGLGTYTYRMGYNTANQVVTTTYPTGETLQHTYTAAWQPRTLASNWATYVPDAQYNVRGQLEWFKAYTSGANSYLKTSYTYFDTGSAPSFRLKQLDVAYEDGLDNLHSRLQLAYRYDPVGNVQAITDTTNAGQVQAFGYDALERLTSAGTNGIGEGQYYDTYSYDALGNFTAMDGRTYVYDPARPHAARYSYVLNGGLYANFDAPGTPSGWDVSGAQNWAAGYPDGAELVLKHGGSTTTSTLYRSGLDLGAGDTAQVEFKVDQADPDITLRVSNDANTQGFGIMDRPGTALRVLKHTGKTVTYQDCGWSLQANTWYVLKLYVGDGTDANKFKVTVWQRDNPGQRCYKEATNTSWTGSWRYRSVANDHAPSVGTTLYQDNYFELQAGGSAFTYAYDPNGNMTARLEAGTAYSQTWDAENRLVSVRYGTTATLGNAYTFAYDADGGRVRQVAPSGAQTAYIGAYEVTITPTLSLLDTFPPGTNPPVGWQVPPPSGSWNASGGIYQQTNAGLQDALSVRTSSTGTNVQASVRVRLDTNDHALAGLALRSAGGVGGAAYIVAIRNSLSGYHCGIFKKVTGVWTAMTPDQSVCKVPLGGWHVVGARVVDVGATDTRIEMLLDGVHILTWTDTSNRLAAGSLGLVTRSGAASFDDVTYHVLAGTNPDEFRTYYAFGAARLAVRHGVGASTGSAAPLYYLAADHLGSVSLAIQTNGQVIGTRAYYLPFGAERGTPASGLPTDRRFVGEIQTPYIELQQFGARWYSSRLGRFVSPDSIVPNPGNPQTHNRYSYVNNRPCTLVDPTGHWACGDADWEAEYEQAHGGEAPYAGAVDDCKLSGSISGGLTWTDTDWIAYTAAKYAGLMRWLSRGVKFAGSWKGIDVEAAILGLNMVQSALGSKADAALHLGNTGLTITAIQGEGPGGLAWPDRISLWFWYNLQPTDSTQFAYAVWTVVHEIGHVVEYSAGFDADAWGAGVPGWYKTSGAWRYNTSADGRPQGNRGYVRPFSVQDVRDDFADTFAAHVYMLGRSPLPYDIIDNLPMMIPSRERWEALNVVLGNLP